MKLQNITFKYGEKTVLENFSAEIPENSFTAVLGKSGTGKTTLIKVITGLKKPVQGKIIHDKKEKFSVVFQEDRLLPFKTVQENIMLTGASEEKALEYLKKVGLENERNSYPEALSGGMKRRVATARALACPDYTFLILDEPFTGQDDTTRKSLIELIKKEAKNKTAVMITHSEEDADILCDNVIRLPD